MKFIGHEQQQINSNGSLTALLFVLLLLVFQPLAWAWQHDMQDMKDMPGMQGMKHDLEESPEGKAKRVADKRESEFNHHLVGFLVASAGLLLLAQGRLAKRWPRVRYAWSVCFFLAGFYLLVFSDTEIWPFGPQSPWYAITHNPEDLQHKLFAVILLGLGFVEFQRTRGRLQAAGSAWVFPVTSLAGAILLLFHSHGTGMDMSQPDAMALMEHIQAQHRSFMAVGVGIALSKGLSETQFNGQKFFEKLWPALLIVLGVLLVLYTE